MCIRDSTNTDKVDIQRVIEIYYSSRQEITDYNSELTPYIQDYIQKSHPNLELDTTGRFIGIKQRQKCEPDILG